MNFNNCANDENDEKKFKVWFVMRKKRVNDPQHTQFDHIYAYVHFQFFIHPLTYQNLWIVMMMPCDARRCDMCACVYLFLVYTEEH